MVKYAKSLDKAKSFLTGIASPPMPIRVMLKNLRESFVDVSEFVAKQHPKGTPAVYKSLEILSFYNDGTVRHFKYYDYTDSYVVGYLNHHSNRETLGLYIKEGMTYTEVDARNLLSPYYTQNFSKTPDYGLKRLSKDVIVTYQKLLNF